MDGLSVLADRITSCVQCPRLVEWRERVAHERRAAFADETYWGRPVPGFGDPDARIVVVGLAPAAHGANRTGRMFTGDRSGDWLYAALWRAGLANQPTSVARRDGLRLLDSYVTSALRCAPPANKPTPEERDRCAPWLEQELRELHRGRVVLSLGAFATHAVARLFGLAPAPTFAHGAQRRWTADSASPWPGRDVALVCSYHPSQQNTFTGKLTEPMFDDAIAAAVELANGL